MNQLRKDYLFTSESVSEGHPDKVADQISDAILDACMEQDKESRVALETLCTTDFILLAGEITTTANVDWERIARGVVRDIGYTDPELGFSADTAEVLLKIHRQSPDIAQGVDAGKNKAQGAGDQGMMFGFACTETDALMPAPIYYAHRIVAELARLRKTEPEKYGFLRPDAKSQVSVRYENDRPVAVDAIVVSTQHTEDTPHEKIESLVRKVAADVIPAGFLTERTVFFVNPTGKFVIGGPAGDTGLTGRKIVVDTYGGRGLHGGGCFSGKDPSKVDRSAAYICRYIAKNIVKAGLADRCQIQVAYAIGVAEPVSIFVDTFGTGKVGNHALEKIIREVFDMTPAGITETLGLKERKGWTYRQTAAYGHFGREGFPWEATDKVDALLEAAKRYAD
ncbi:MAG: methionine adenosyltransferase [Lentisphaeria bacterium]|nr:methionine adenosyltransferase [Lentisphaeria bacterium]